MIYKYFFTSIKADIRVASDDRPKQYQSGRIANHSKTGCIECVALLNITGLKATAEPALALL